MDNRFDSLPDSERCDECGQPDNCGDCDHTPLSEGEATALLGMFAVGRTDGAGVITRYATLAEAEARIAEIEKTDPTGVYAGEYFIDAPEVVRPDGPETATGGLVGQAGY